jgi:hypothetical protein
VSYEEVQPAFFNYKIVKKKNFGSYYVWVYKLVPQKTQPSEIDKSKIKVDALNSCGVSGEAARMADILRQAGFNVQKVENADSCNYAQTELRYKKGRDEAANLLAKDLSQYYPAALKQTFK